MKIEALKEKIRSIENSMHVLFLTAEDELAVSVVNFYAQRLGAEGRTSEAAIMSQEAANMEHWRRDNITSQIKTPDPRPKEEKTIETEAETEKINIVDIPPAATSEDAKNLTNKFKGNN